MTYVFYGTEEFLIKKELNKIKEKYNIDDINISSYDLENSKLEDIIDDASTISLFSNNKMIVCDNAYVFTGTTNKKLPEQNIKVLEDYLNNDNSDTILIFVVNKDKLDERKKVVKLLKEKKQIKEFNKISNVDEFIIKEFEPYKISRKEINLLRNRVGENLNLLYQEINKIKLYKDDVLEIYENDIIDLTTKNIDTDIFNLIENIVMKNKVAAIESYKEMLRLGEEPIKIIVMLANQFRLIYQSRNLYKKGYSEKDISSMLNVHPYRIKLALNKGSKFQDDVLILYLEKLANLDINIKSGKIDKDLGLELFILSL